MSVRNVKINGCEDVQIPDNCNNFDYKLWVNVGIAKILIPDSGLLILSPIGISKSKTVSLRGTKQPHAIQSRYIGFDIFDVITPLIPITIPWVNMGISKS
jgi:hypothetical protein